VAVQLDAGSREGVHVGQAVIDSGGLITPVVSGRSTGATFSFTRVAMPVNVTGDGKSVCSLLADVKPAHLQGDQFSFTGVSLTNITDGIRKNKMVLDGDPAHELTLLLPAGRFADLRTFIIPADKTLTVRGVDTLAVPAAGVPDRRIVCKGCSRRGSLAVASVPMHRRRGAPLAP
jgi:hypothetical protein